ncbi:MAG: anhydro-N-acetylmuramic acid kinase [Catenulispora sp.]|nr:anhydro-N-acetylmuramic acid kinase [Catenulispora sp.]
MKVLGLSSGTSHDAIDVALVEFRLDGDVLVGRLRHADHVPYPERLRADILAALPPNPTDLGAVCRLDTEIGQAFAAAAWAATRESGPADLVCSHGQTLFHWAEEGTVRGTLQLGQPAWIAERLGVPVVSDVRTADVAAGGQGAPLVSLLDLLLLRDLPGPVGALNLGGIANLTVVTDPPTAFDIGPANALLDAAARRLTGKPFDRDGRLAAAGLVHPGLLGALLAEPYYARRPPKTTGKELFHDAYLTPFIEAFPDLTPEDLMSTLATLTATTVIEAVRAHDIATLAVSGGGTDNPELMKRITKRLPGVEVLRSDAYKVPSDAKEAIAFALIGWFTAHGLPGTIPTCTGARGGRVLGRVTPPADRPLVLPEPVEKAPVAVRFEA